MNEVIRWLFWIQDDVRILGAVAAASMGLLMLASYIRHPTLQRWTLNTALALFVVSQAPMSVTTAESGYHQQGTCLLVYLK